MLYLLMVLAALSQLKTGVSQAINGAGTANIALCKITYYGKTYDKLYVNTSTAELAMCFDGYFQGSGGDCVIVKSGSNYISPFITPGSTAMPLTSIQTAMTCYIQSLTHSTIIPSPQFIQADFYNHGQEAAFSMKATTDYPDNFLSVEILAGGKIMHKKNLTKAAAQSMTYFDISGCRRSGQIMLPGAELKIPSSCDKVVCNDSAVLKNVTCDSTEFCDASFQCSMDTMCTVTGCTVIDILGKATSVQDRCVYELMTPKDTNITVLAEFRERRRRDVSFLYRLIVQKDSVDKFIVDQNGRVWVDGKLETLTNTPQTFNNMVLYKNQKGVTIQISLTCNVTIFFNGDTVQIHVKGPNSGNIKGLCANSNQLSAMKHAGLSNSDCGTQYNDTADATINCTLMSARCDALKGAPFTTCNINPDPYIEACKKALCKYPAVDGLKCHFMEAYARECEIRRNTTIAGWKSTLNCAASPRAFCSGRICSPHEFCGEKTTGGETRCLCRAIFASNNGSAFDTPTICKGTSASVTLVGCLLEKEGLNYTNLHLNDGNCTGQVDDETHTVSFSFNSSNTCGTVVTSNDTHVIYKNTIMHKNISGGITRTNDVLIDFFCCYEQPPEKSVTFETNISSVTVSLKYGKWVYNLTMKPFLDDGLTLPVVAGSIFQLNKKICMELKAEGVNDNKLTVVIESCWGTHDPYSNGTLRHDLIKNSCANRNDGTVMVGRNGKGISSYFCFNTFRFMGRMGAVHLHCKVHLCSTINNNNCVPNCSSSRKRRRSARHNYDVQNSAVLSMSWIH